MDNGKKDQEIGNIVTERFWRKYKYEYLYFRTPNEGKKLYDATKEYMDFYYF